MKYTVISDTDLSVSCIALGTANFGSAINQRDSFALLDLYILKGGNFIDTALIYADWACQEKSISEKTIGAG